MFKTEITEGDIKDAIEVSTGNKVYIHEEKTPEGRRITIIDFKTKVVIYDRILEGGGNKYKIIITDLISKSFKKKK